MDDIVVINNLTKRFSQITALDNFSIKLPKGKVIGMLGPNGSGKTTLIKILTNLSMQYEGEVLINGQKPGIETKKIVSYLPDCNFLSDSWTVNDAIEYFVDFFVDFDEQKARNLISQLGINFNQKIKTLSKGTKEKVQLILVMSRNASLYILDEPIAGVDPAARDYILRTIINNYNPEATVLISTHLIEDVEQVLDEVIFMRYGQLVLYTSVDNIREEKGKSVDAYFREVFAC